ADAVEAQDKFRKKHDLQVTLASDESHKMLEAYGVWGEKSMYGRTFMGITRRPFWLAPTAESRASGPRSKSTDTPPRCSRRPRRCRPNDSCSGRSAANASGTRT